jgi:hypothetical protein
MLTRSNLADRAPLGTILDIWAEPNGAVSAELLLVSKINYRANTWFVVLSDLARKQQECNPQKMALKTVELGNILVAF